MKEAVIVSGARTPIGNFGGSLKEIPVINLGSLVIKEALRRAGLKPKSSKELLGYGPDALKDSGMIELEKKYYDWDSSLREVQIDEVIMGNVLQGVRGKTRLGRRLFMLGFLKKRLPSR